MKVMRKIIEIDEERCNGCGNCVLACAEGAIQIIDGKAKVIADKYCDGLGACIGDCPEEALKIIEREADDFDEAAVEELLKEKATKPSETIACGCSSSVVQTFPTAPAAKTTDCACANKAVSHPGSGVSSLGHWPVQIKLVPAGAPFLKGAHLVVAADCVPVAYPTFHADFLKGKAIMIGCPKFDDADAYVEKLSQVFAVSGIKTITVVRMEVPCCSALPMIVKKALEKSEAQIPLEEVVVSAQGKILS